MCKIYIFPIRIGIGMANLPLFKLNKWQNYENWSNFPLRSKFIIIIVAFGILEKKNDDVHAFRQ